MGIFGSKKEDAAVVKRMDAKKPVTKAVAVVGTPMGSSARHAGAVIRPHITEKSGILSQGGVYTFEVSANANKNAVAQAISALYKVTPVKVAVINVPSKNVFVRGRRGVVPGVRKAMVTLKKGDKIDFV